MPPLDAVVISHNHYDHLDVTTVRNLDKKFPNLYWFVPRGVKSFMLATVTHAKAERIHEFMWWDEQEIGNTGVTAVFTPAQHWSARNLIFDRDAVSFLSSFAQSLISKGAVITATQTLYG